MMNDVSKYFKKPTYEEMRIARLLIEKEETPEAIGIFADNADKLGDYTYWFLLSTCWVSYTGWSDLALWKELFASERPKRKLSIMKPSEVKFFEYLPNMVTVYRAHRPGEEDWIAYTLDEEIVKRFAQERGVNTYKKYKVNKRHIIALFLRRGEQEVIVLDKEKAEFVEEVNMVVGGK